MENQLDQKDIVAWRKRGFITWLLVVLGVLLIAAVVGGVYVWQRMVPENEVGALRSEVEELRRQVEGGERGQAQEKVYTLGWNEAEVMLNGETVVRSEDFSQDVEVAEDASFGGSNSITGAKLSPDGKWIAISAAGAAHGFGWLYAVDTTELRPVVFQYGGSVNLRGWKDNGQEVVFIVTTPQPAEQEVGIHVNQLPEYPRVP